MFNLNYLMGWQRQMAQGARRPLWDFLARDGIDRDAAEARVGARPVLCADLRCSICASKAECDRRLAAGGAPVDGCPNAALLKHLA
jgi:hypothetical protein